MGGGGNVVALFTLGVGFVEGGGAGIRLYSISRSVGTGSLTGDWYVMVEICPSGKRYAKHA